MPASPQSPNNVMTAIIASLSHIETQEHLIESHETSTKTSSTSTVLAKLSLEEQSRAKNALLTLHFLFPHEMLPALDILDRGLVSCLRQQHTGSDSIPGADTTPKELHSVTYYVQSASGTSLVKNRFSSPSTNASSAGASGRFRNAYTSAGMLYEVHLDSWNCTCPAFAFSSMKQMMAASGLKEQNDETNPMVQGQPTDDGYYDTKFGGSATRPDAVAPVCKHILAVVLGTSAPNLFGNSIEILFMDRDEIAGRAAGWGER